MATVLLNSNESFTFSAGNTATVFGSTGTEKVLLSGTPNVTVDQGVERVELVGKASDYTYQVVGNQVIVKSGTTTVATVGVQDDADGTVVAFADGSASLKVTGLNAATLGGATVPAAAAAAVVPTALNTADKSTVTPPASNAPAIGIAGSASVVEGSSATYTVTRTGDLSKAATVDFTLAGGGGATTTDFGAPTVTGSGVTGSSLTAAGGSIAFTAGVAQATIAIPVTFDSATETGETLAAALKANATDASASAVSGLVTTALQDPPAPTFALTSDAAAGVPTQEGKAITFTVTPSGIVTSDTTFTLNLTGAEVGSIAAKASAADFSASPTVTFKAGETAARTVQITVTDDNAVEGIEGYKASLLDKTFTELASTTGTINDPTPNLSLSVSPLSPTPGVNEGAAVVYTVTSDRVAPAGGIVIPYTLTGNATPTADFTGSAATGTVTIAAGATTGTVTLNAVADNATEGAETVTLTLGTPNVGTVTATPLTTTINDTSTALAANQVGLSGPASVNESASAVYTISVSAAVTGTALSVPYTLSGTTANGTDYSGSATTGTLTIPVGSTSATLTLPVTADSTTEGPETIIVTLGTPTGGGTTYTVASGQGVVTTTVADTSVTVPGQNIVFTTGIDILLGGAGNDTFVGSFDGLATSTSNLGDSADGGAGADTARITSNANATVIPTLTNVENLIVNDTAHETRDVSTIAGLTSYEMEQGTTIDGNMVTVTVAAGQALSLDRVTDADAGAAAVADGGISIASAAGVTALSVTADSVGAQTGATANTSLVLGIAGTGVTTLNLTGLNTNNAVLLNAGGALTTVNYSGAGTTTFFGTNPTTIATLNASSATGGLTFDLSASTGANQTITGGSGGDTLTVDLQRNITLDAGAGSDVVALTNAVAANLSSTLGSADSIKGGDGTDVLSLLAAGAAALAGDTAADRAVISGFERLRVSDDLNGNTFDISAFGLNYLQVGADITTAAATVNGFTSGATVEFRAANATAATQFVLNVGITGATGAGTPNDTLNLVLNADLINQGTAGAIDTESVQIEVGVSGINKLNVSTADRDNTNGATTRDDGYTLTLTNDNNVDTITVTGDRELSFTSTTSTAALATINASGSSGDLIVNLTANGLTQGVSVTGSTGTNTITGTAFGDVIIGGGQSDNITGGAGADALTGGAGADTFVFAAGSSGGAPSATVFDTIADFGKNSDIIDHASDIAIVTNGTASSGTAAINAEGIATFNAADNTLALRIVAAESGINAGGAAAAGQTVIFEFGSDSYVFVSDGVDGVAANDVLVKLTGVTGLTDSTIANNNLLIA
jgi:hypothetical protein